MKEGLYMKLPNGFGSVHKLSGNRRKPWRARKTIGWEYVDKATGKPVKVNSDTNLNDIRQKQLYVTVGYYETRKQAYEALALYNSDPHDLHHDVITFGELYEKWSDEYFARLTTKNSKTAPKQIKDYEASFRLCAFIKDMCIHDIKLEHLQKVVDTSGKNTPTLRKLRTLFNSVFDYALKHEIISKDKRTIPSYVDISKPGNPNAVDRMPFTNEERNLLWQYKDANTYMSVILILIYTGVRISELLDLKKENIHLNERWFYVGESKTEAGIREVPIAEKIVPFFQYWLSCDCEYLICTPDEKPFTYRNYYDSYWIPLMLQMNMGEFVMEEDKKEPVYKGHRPHDTRHTCISMLTETGVDERIIKKIVGHKGQGVTQAVYTHIELPIKLEAINKI